MSADILGTNWDQCRSMVQYSFTSTETRRLVRTDSPGRPPRLSHSSWTMIHPRQESSICRVSPRPMIARLSTPSHVHEYHPPPDQPYSSLQVSIILLLPWMMQKGLPRGWLILPNLPVVTEMVIISLFSSWALSARRPPWWHYYRHVQCIDNGGCLVASNSVTCTLTAFAATVIPNVQGLCLQYVMRCLVR